MYDVVIKGGLIVGGPMGTSKADLAISGERVAAIGQDLKGKRVIDASGMLVLPGAIDAHVHMELPVSGTRSSDTFASGTKAAACGGVTTVIDFTVGSSQSSIPEDIERRLVDAKRSYIDYALHAEVIGWRKSRAWEMLKAIQLGVTSFKFFTAYGSSGRRTDRGALFEAFQVIGELGALAIVHAEDEEIINCIMSSSGDELAYATLASKAPLCEATRSDSSIWQKTGEGTYSPPFSAWLEALGEQKAFIEMRRQKLAHNICCSPRTSMTVLTATSILPLRP